VHVSGNTENLPAMFLMNHRVYLAYSPLTIYIVILKLSAGTAHRYGWVTTQTLQRALGITWFLKVTITRCSVWVLFAHIYG